MTSKRILGFVFIAIAILLTLAIIGQLPTLISVIISFFTIFTGKLNSYQGGEVFGHIIYWGAHFIATILLWKYGIQWLRKKPKE